MADKKAGGLYLSIGLTLSQLQSDFLAAEQTVKQGIAALNRQQNLIKLRMEADTAGLDRAKDATKILEIQEQSLTQVLQMQRDKLTLATKAYQDVAQSKGANSAAAKQLETSMERERLAVARLEAQLKSLSAQKIAIDSTKLQTQLQDNISRLNAKIQNVKIQAELDTSKFKSAGSVFDAQKVQIAAVTKEIELQRQKLAQLQAQMYQSARQTGADSSTTLNVKSNVLQQIQEINRLQTRLKELQSTNINVQIRADSLKRVEADITENIARINAKIEHIKVKTDIDVSKLGTAASEFDKAKAHVQGLNRELDLQNQKLAEMKRALGNSISTNGLNNVKTINLQTEIQRQIQAVDQLKAKIQELNKIAPPKTNSLLSGYQSLKGNITGKIGELSGALTTLQGATTSADSAIVSMLSVVGSIPTPVGLAVAALVGVPLIFKGIENSIIDMTRAAAASGDAVYVMSRGMQMSVADAGKFSTNAKVAGAQVNDLAMAVKNVQRQVARGGEDSRAVEWLKRYGESAYDASGNLKDLNQMTFALSKALHKAQEDGKGAEFVLNVFRNVSADAITAIEDWADVNEQASRIVKAGLANPKLAHEVQGNLNALNVQSAQLGTSFTNALLPVANEVIPRVTERMGKMAQIIADNKEMIRSFGRAAADAFLKVEQAAETVGKAFLSVGKAYYDWQKNPRQDAIIEKYKGNTDIKTVDDLIRAEQPAAFNVIKENPFLYQQTLSIYEPMFRALQDVQDEVKRRNEELAKLLKQPLSGADLSTIGQERRAIEQNPEVLETLRRARKYQEEADAIIYKMNHGDYKSKKNDLDIWWNQIVRENEKSEAEIEALAKLRSAKLEQIEKEHLEKIQQYWRDAADIEYNLTHSAFEKQLRDIEQWREAQLKKASTAEEVQGIIANAAAKEAEAFESAMDRIRGKLQSLDDDIFSLEHSQYEQDLRRIQQKYFQRMEDYQKEGIFNSDLKAKLDYWYNLEKGKIDARAAESREKEGDTYTKQPEGAMQRGGNGIVVIGADKIIDDGQIQQSIGLIADESRERAQLMQGLSAETRERIAAIDAARRLNEAQKNLAQQASGFQLIEGDRVAEQAQAGGYQVISGDQVVSGLQELNNALQETDPLKNLETSAQGAADAQKALAESAQALPPEYFQNLADGTKAISEMQQRQTESTMRLIEAQDKLAKAIENMEPTRDTSGNQQVQRDGMMRLANNSDARQAQDLLARQNRDDTHLRAISDIPRQSQIPQRESGFKLGFDTGVFGDLAQTGLAALALMSRLGAMAPHPVLKAGALILGGAAGAGLGVGTTEKTLNSREPQQVNESLKPFAEADLSGLVRPVINIDGNVQSIAQKFQSEAEAATLTPETFAPLANLDTPLTSILQQLQDERSQELFGTLPNIEAGVQDILMQLQAQAEAAATSPQVPEGVSTSAQMPAAQETMQSFEVVVAPLNNIATLVGNILTALENRQPPQITISPNNNIDLGGAYVFDNAMKTELVNDITSKVVDEITAAVRQGVSSSSYNYGA